MTNSVEAKKKGWNKINEKYKRGDIKFINDILKN